MGSLFGFVVGATEEVDAGIALRESVSQMLDYRCCKDGFPAAGARVNPEECGVW
jgi:hypothetical protein